MKRPDFYNDFISKFPNRPKYEQFQMYVSKLEEYANYLEKKNKCQENTKTSNKYDSKALHITDIIRNLLNLKESQIINIRGLCNHKKTPVINFDGNAIGSYCSKCDIFYNNNGIGLKCCLKRKDLYY